MPWRNSFDATVLAAWSAPHIPSGRETQRSIGCTIPIRYICPETNLYLAAWSCNYFALVSSFGSHPSLRCLTNGVRQSSGSSPSSPWSIAMMSKLSVATLGVYKTSKKTPGECGPPQAADFANASASSFWPQGKCSTVIPAKLFSIDRTVSRYFLIPSSFASNDFSTWLATSFQSVQISKRRMPSAFAFLRPLNTASYLAVLLVVLNCNLAA